MAIFVREKGEKSGKTVWFLGSKKKRERAKGWRVSFGVCIKEGKQREHRVFFFLVSVQAKESEFGKGETTRGSSCTFPYFFVASLVHFVPRITHEHCN